MIYAITDLETTGGSLKTTKITEIAIFLHDGSKIIDSYTSLIQPTCAIPPFISRLTGITDEMVADAPKFHEVARKIVEFTEDTIFVAHNVGFDYNVLRQEFKSLGYDFRKPHLCTVRASRYMLPGFPSYSLGKLTDQLGIKIQARHRASGDAAATAELFALLYQKNSTGLNSFVQRDINPKSLHPGLDISTLDDLSSKTGVYKFYSAEKELLYIGKSKNIKTRVLQHLKNASSRRAIQLNEQITEVQEELTGSELIALLRESELIKKYQPRYNRQLRKSRSNFGLYSYTDGHGYINLFSDRTKNHEQVPLATFEKKADANRFLDLQAERYQLCKKLVATYPSQGYCFAYHIKECQGACMQEEDPISYNDRVKIMLDRLSFRDASFYIVEKGRSSTEIGLILIENGTYVGYGYVPTTVDSSTTDNWRTYITTKQEDKDAHRIIQSYLRTKPSLNIRGIGEGKY